MKPLLQWQLDQITKELLLLQQHIADPTCPCETETENCVRKHLLTLEGLMEETLPMVDGKTREQIDDDLAYIREMRKRYEQQVCPIEKLDTETQPALEQTQKAGKTIKELIEEMYNKEGRPEMATYNKEGKVEMEDSKISIPKKIWEDASFVCLAVAPDPRQREGLRKMATNVVDWLYEIEASQGKPKTIHKEGETEMARNIKRWSDVADISSAMMAKLYGMRFEGISIGDRYIDSLPISADSKTNLATFFRCCHLKEILLRYKQRGKIEASGSYIKEGEAEMGNSKKYAIAITGYGGEKFALLEKVGESSMVATREKHEAELRSRGYEIISGSIGQQQTPKTIQQLLQEQDVVKEGKL
ncbi:hypothetical protein KKF45_05550 [Patescibacteria group bacterium]|nr:hypothetical protein [Patescibacteria group bacterium]